MQNNNIIDNFIINEIPKNANFWMIRTQGGFFYSEYIKDKFVALGWNSIDSNTVFNSDNLEVLKERIKNIYGNKRPSDSINKSKRFMYEMKEGDYVLIPSENSAEIAICRIGEYFEIDYNYKEELKTIIKIKNKESIIGEVKCPYKKRRRIEVLITVSSKRIGYKLLRAISSYHGLSDMNEYAVDILNCLYDCYVFDDDMYIPINISKTKSITAKELSELMYGVTNLFSQIVIKDEYILATANINSPGKYVVQLKKAYRVIKKGGVSLIALSVFLFGGEFAGNKVNGAVNGVMDAVNGIETRNVEIEKKQEELKSYKLDNCLKAIEAIKKSEELSPDIDIKKIRSNIEIILEVDSTLNLASNKKFAQENKEDDLDDNLQNKK